MARLPWQDAEEEFDSYWTKKGKAAHLFVFKDAATLRAMNKRATAVGTQPSDRLVTFEGVTFFAEVKSTKEPVSFPFGIIKASQHGYAQMTTAAGGHYFVFVKSLVLNRWFKIPYSAIAAAPGSSIKWTDLETMSWNIST